MRRIRRWIPGARRLSILIAMWVLPLAAQEARIEVQVPLDSAGTLLELTPELRSRARLFPEVEQFTAARLFRQEDSLFVLEIAFRREGVPARSRTRFDASALRVFRRELERHLATAVRPAGVDQEGKAGLIVRQTVLGLGFYGWMVPQILQIKGGRETVAAYMLVGSAGFALPYYLTRNRPVSQTRAMLTSYGSTRGIFYGVLLRTMLAPHAKSDAGRMAPPLLGSIAGAAGGFTAGGGSALALGRAELVGVMGDLGTGLGLGTAHVLGLWEVESREPAAAAVSLGMTGLGFAAGAWLSQREHYTRGDAYVLRMQGILGAQIMMPIAAALGGKKDKSWSTGAMLGGALGTGLGNRLLHNEDFDDNAGVLISCAQIAGGLLAGGLTYLVDSQDRFDPLVYHSTIALGSLAGHALLYHTFKLRD
ncbi:MAG TPA: hypothetical protein PKI62_10105 [bacterium]|nr:hypothetical protein [bacterium]HPR89181.1 hypothetical protein [bacterium]